MNDRMPPGVHYTTTAADLLRIVSELPGDTVLIGWHISAWKCACHPWANWTYYANYPDCRISDTNYAPMIPEGGQGTYGDGYPDVAALEAAHGPLRFSPAPVLNGELAEPLYRAAAKVEAAHAVTSGEDQ